MIAFSEGDIVVRDNAKYPEGALVVDGIDENGALLAHPLGGGLQIALPAAVLGRFQLVEEPETVPVFTRGTFCIEDVDGEFEGWSDGTSWNGWEKPCFIREVSEQILNACGNRFTYEPSSDEFIVLSCDEDEPERFPGQRIEFGDGGSAKVYFIGAGSWIWDKVS